MQKKLSIAFIWHMHQPVYQSNPNEMFLMPWVRLHAVKDYLDMVLFLEKFPKLKLNFNLVPILIDAIELYTDKGFHDIHSKLTITDINEFSDDDKMYVLNNFFDANYHNMILHHKYYSKLYDKRFSKAEISVDDFSNSEYSDIMTWFNLAWIDPCWKHKYPEINYLLEKEKNFSLQDRIMLIDLHRRIISEVIPTYKKYQDLGRIELSTSPYYHPILPLLIDMDDSKSLSSRHSQPKIDSNMKKDAENQLNMALDRMEEVFGKRPKGIWPSEQCVSEKTIDLLTKIGVKWTIADEGILAGSLDREFVRDFRGYLEDPYDLTQIYRKTNKDEHINILFRDSVLPNLISFEYPHHDSKIAASDFYERVKTIQGRIKNSPDKHHLLTIAMDGENSWENYLEDGEIFLHEIYKRLEEDDTLQTVLVSEYLDKVKSTKELKKLMAGSWINRDFQLWVAEPTKNLAWECLDKARKDLIVFEKKIKDKQKIKQAWKQIYIAQGSDWFWWYGEPNDSGQDQIFDYLFREHLKYMYTILDKEPPKYLENSLLTVIVKPSRASRALISPEINGKADNIDSWYDAGQVEVIDGPNIKADKLFNKILFGNDNENLYLRFDMNPYILDKLKGLRDSFQMYVYFKKQKGFDKSANIRLAGRLENLVPLLKDKYHYEVMIPFHLNSNLPAKLCYATNENLWVSQISNKIEYALDEVLEIKIPFDDLHLENGENIKFVIADTSYGFVEDVYPQDLLLSITRPD